MRRDSPASSVSIAVPVPVNMPAENPESILPANSSGNPRARRNVRALTPKVRARRTARAGGRSRPTDARTAESQNHADCVDGENNRNEHGRKSELLPVYRIERRRQRRSEHRYEKSTGSQPKRRCSECRRRRLLPTGPVKASSRHRRCDCCVCFDGLFRDCLERHDVRACKVV